jgi:uncharacterized protein YgbK (DUF1537 family)
LDLACLLIADDLTGACDAAAQFALRGLAARVSLDPGSEAGATGVLAISTESRGGDLASFRQALERLPPLRPRILFKKIDSTLRGNIGQEVAATLAVFGCDRAVVTPAFPAMGRAVEAGYLRVVGDSGFVPREVAGCFRDLPAAVRARIALRDAACDAHLDAIVREELAGGRRILWAGSAGLAAALARATGAGSAAEMAFSPGPGIFCLGSDHAVTLAQQERLLRHRAAALFAAGHAPNEAILDALERRRHVVLRISRGHTSAARVRQLLMGIAGPLALCGGDTASLVCCALAVNAIELRREVAPGIPCGIIQGGPFDALPVVTKSGGFGRPDALIEVADFFTCSPPLH